ncbi:MAG: sugar ABC transporter permease [Bacillota bacterium]|uniref:Arabinogalactan oligomer / maltooligosaccharide transport system permease protein n=2 Tax=Carboxydocella TaxID=178898 RepID=A0A1T4R7X5_9FIRM|nr:MULTISPECIES: carbohydrate ABC transporter permease [Carboxydocella]AVX19730.1 arabinogalactan oligomer / maltooligosaccharide transport system permease protein [Carboxydocella thermautotrophica]AVX30141.1 arabinogalactan oligomer / maltooligosaccharide transport system permease protein [Carboxydocella thermautotrophica]GAW31365.1 ABC transporter permease [Carboxydocella sp. JDF658]SKA12180.1 arabinogalactan oligomer / maltooligosaccharide transport system permease protein [Carboxydocella sp
MKKKTAKRWVDLLVHIILALASIISVFPVVWVLSTSFKPESEVFSNVIRFIPEHPTLDNYRYILTFKNHIFLTWLVNSALIAFLTTLVGVFLAATAAYAFSRFEFLGKQTGLFSFLVAQMFPGSLLIVPLYNIIKSYGLLNSYTGLVLAYSTVSLPFCVWMLKGFFDTIPVELEEAARVDGLTPFGTFWRIVLPLSLPGLAVTAFYSFVTAWNEFMYALTFMNREELYTLPVGLRTFVNEFNTDWHYMSAGAILITVPVVIFFFWAQKYLISGLTAGGTKG